MYSFSKSKTVETTPKSGKIIDTNDVQGSTHGYRPNLSKLVSKVSPTIVSIYTKVTIETTPAEIFGPFMFQEPRKIEREALGSGVIIDSRGLIVTNDHVIDKSEKIKACEFNIITYIPIYSNI